MVRVREMHGLNLDAGMSIPDISTAAEWQARFVERAGGRMEPVPQKDRDGGQAFRWTNGEQGWRTFLVFPAPPATFVKGDMLPNGNL